MNGIKGLTLLAVSLAGLTVLAGCAGGGRVESTADEEDNDNPASGTIEGGGKGGASPNLATLVVIGSLGLATLWTARRIGRDK